MGREGVSGEARVEHPSLEDVFVAVTPWRRMANTMARRRHRVMNMLRRIFAIAHKEFMHLRRDKLTFGMIAGIPLMLTLIFGYGINQDVRHLNAGRRGYVAHPGLAPADRGRAGDPDRRSRNIMVDSPQALQALLREGKISIGIRHPGTISPTGWRGGTGRWRSCWSTAAIRRCFPPPGNCRQCRSRPARRRRSLDVVQQPGTFEVRALYNPGAPLGRVRRARPVRDHSDPDAGPVRRRLDRAREGARQYRASDHHAGADL